MWIVHTNIHTHIHTYIRVSKSELLLRRVQIIFLGSRSPGIELSYIIIIIHTYIRTYIHPYIHRDGGLDRVHADVRPQRGGQDGCVYALCVCKYACVCLCVCMCMNACMHVCT